MRELSRVKNLFPLTPNTRTITILASINSRRRFETTSMSPTSAMPRITPCNCSPVSPRSLFETLTSPSIRRLRSVMTPRGKTPLDRDSQVRLGTVRNMCGLQPLLQEPPCPATTKFWTSNAKIRVISDSRPRYRKSSASQSHGSIGMASIRQPKVK
jgi:hypothetical protein